jgi:hypothetical protein
MFVNLWLFGIFCGRLAYFMVFWYIFGRSGMFDPEKSGNPVRHLVFELFCNINLFLK